MSSLFFPPPFRTGKMGDPLEGAFTDYYYSVYPDIEKNETMSLINHGRTVSVLGCLAINNTDVGESVSLDTRPLGGNNHHLDWKSTGARPAMSAPGVHSTWPDCNQCQPWNLIKAGSIIIKLHARAYWISSNVHNTTNVLWTTFTNASRPTQEK